MVSITEEVATKLELGHLLPDSMAANTKFTTTHVGNKCCLYSCHSPRDLTDICYVYYRIFFMYLFILYSFFLFCVFVKDYFVDLLFQ